MPKPRILVLLLLIILSLSWLSSSGLWKGFKSFNGRAVRYHSVLPDWTAEKVKVKAGQARAYVRQKNFNDDICFLIDMSRPSYQNRFFVYDLKKDTLQNAGLVTHGNCFQSWLEGRQYGNEVGCGCTSLGRYRVGYSYNGKFGLAFKLYGLDSSNNKAFERFVVLHGHSCVPETEVTDEICQSNGCPTVAPGFLQQLKPIITASKKPVLLWIFD